MSTQKNLATIIKPRIFIASSVRAKPIAEELATRLEDAAEVEPWWDAFDAGVSTLDQLVRLAGSCDFAAVLLTADDVIIKDNQPEGATQPEAKRAKDRRVARDNCIFELGLFTGALGLDPQRAFILTSLDKSDLPSDFQDITHLKVAEMPIGGFTVDQVKEKAAFDTLIEAASKRIKAGIEKLEFCFDRPKQLKVVPGANLMQREKLKPDGGRILKEYGVNVIVHSAQPVEKHRDFAKIVQRNMREEVSYIYFFEGDNDSLLELPSLLRGLATADLEDTDAQTVNKGYWKKAMRATAENEDTVLESLDNMKDHLRIFLLESTEQVQFCIHNANKTAAVCYLRYAPQHFVKWCSGEDAKKMADKLLEKGVPNFRDAKQIFNGSTTFDLYADEPSKERFRQDLWRAIQDLFPEEFKSTLKEACFGDKLDGQTAAQPGPAPAQGVLAAVRNFFRN